MAVEVTLRRCEKGGDRALHVDGPPAAQLAVAHSARKGVERPGLACAWRDHIGVAGKTEIGPAGAAARIEIVDRLAATLGEDQPVAGKAQLFQCHSDDVERTFIFRGDARPADQLGGKRRRVDSGIAHSRNSSLIEVLARVPSSTVLTMTVQ